MMFLFICTHQADGRLKTPWPLTFVDIDFLTGFYDSLVQNAVLAQSPAVLRRYREMHMLGNLPNLVETGGTVDVQSTTFSLDAVARYVCSTWEEATANGGAPFDAIVIGSGMYGGYCAQKIWRMGAARKRRVLVLEAGPFLVSEHVQNLARIGFSVPAPISTALDPLKPRELVWGLPWRGNVEFPGLAYCVGGKSLYWGGWCPRLTEQDLALWPKPVAGYLRDAYPRVEAEVGVTPSADYITGILYQELRRALATVTPQVLNIDLALGDQGVQEAPLAVQGAPPAPGLFSFDKYSSAPLLMDAVREAYEVSGGNDAVRRLFLVPRAHVRELQVSGGYVSRLRVEVNGRIAFLDVPPTCRIVLAASTIESTRLALHSFPTSLMGRNLMGHLRTNFAARIDRAAFSGLPHDLETAAALVRGSTAQGRFHLQVTASANQNGDSDALLFRMIPDLDLLDSLLANDDPRWVSVTVRGIAEMRGDKSGHGHAADRSWIDLSPFEREEDGLQRAWVNFAAQQPDLQLWNDMDQAALDLLARLAGGKGIEYLWNGGWQSVPPPSGIPFPPWREGLGTTYHEAGTLWMGEDPANSVTDLDGRFHHISNAYVCDQSLFPTVGSVNPVLTGLSLARKVAEHIAS
jgi:GMC oxidoreductase